MNIYDYDDMDIADEIIRAIEKDYGRGIARIPFFERADRYSFDIKVIFADFKLLEATIFVTPSYFGDMATVNVEGIYY